MKGAYLGPEFSDAEIETELRDCGANFKKLSEAEMIEEVASALADEKAVGWMQGRMEFGPRALGGRSIIADPRSPVMQKQLNLKVKYRESFRPIRSECLKRRCK
jgi:carbamoyltransferase